MQRLVLPWYAQWLASLRWHFPGQCWCYGLLPCRCHSDSLLGVGSTAPAAIANLIVAARGNPTTTLQRLIVSAGTKVLISSAVTFVAYLSRSTRYWTVASHVWNSIRLLRAMPPVVSIHLKKSSDPSRSCHVGVSWRSHRVRVCQGWRERLDGIGSRVSSIQRIHWAQEQQEMTRWGALTAFQLLSKNKDKYDALVGAFRSKKSVAECVALLESR
jgi:hypothetical protein